MVIFFCVIVGVAGSAFEVAVDSGASVSALKKAIKKAKSIKLREIDADDLQLFLAIKDGAWLADDDEDPVVLALAEGKTNQDIWTMLEKNPMRATWAIEDVLTANKMIKERAPKSRQIHVLVVVPKGEGLGKRIRVDEWFGNKDFQEKKRRVEEEDVDHPIERVTKFFQMKGFPPLAHPKEKYSMVVERESYLVIFEQLMQNVAEHLSKEKSANMFKHKKVRELPAFELVLNFDNLFHKYDAEQKEFIELDEAGVKSLRIEKRNVLRLIEGSSVSLTGWTGVSILFSSPGLIRIRDYLKVNAFTYIMPAWTLEELQTFNSLLDDSKISENTLISRYNKFGGIPRFVFTITEYEHDVELNKAVNSYSAMKIISFAKTQQAVRDVDYSHRILEMVPSEPNCRASFYLDFLSNYIAEKIVAQMGEESLRKVSEFAIAHATDDSGSTAVVRGTIYEMLCHRWFNLPKEQSLQFRSLCSDEKILNLAFPAEMQTRRFSTLEEIRQIPQGWTYYRPTAKKFGALDAFIVDGDNLECYGLQMTLNRDHGIQGTPLNKFLLWLDGICIPREQFYFGFVVPSDVESSYRKQTIRTKKNKVSVRPGDSARVQQFVAALDVFLGSA